MIRVLIADDQDLVRAGLRMILETADELDVVAEAADGDAAVELAARCEPDVALMDIRMPRCDGIQATRRLAALASPPKVLVLTTFDTDDNVYDALAAGASGFLLKTAAPARLIDAIRCVHSGEALLAPTVTRRLIQEHLGRSRPDPALLQQLDALTDREREVLALVARGYDNRRIARDLFLSDKTVRNHVSNVMGKLGVATRAEAVVRGRNGGLG
jgi:DNA-binding NarL/FixJ family response regulator